MRALTSFGLPNGTGYTVTYATQLLQTTFNEWRHLTTCRLDRLTLPTGAHPTFAYAFPPSPAGTQASPSTWDEIERYAERLSRRLQTVTVDPLDGRLVRTEIERASGPPAVHGPPARPGDRQRLRRRPLLHERPRPLALGGPGSGEHGQPSEVEPLRLRAQRSGAIQRNSRNGCRALSSFSPIGVFCRILERGRPEDEGYRFRG
jgi:hypothetical protein